VLTRVPFYAVSKLYLDHDHQAFENILNGMLQDRRMHDHPLMFYDEIIKNLGTIQPIAPEENKFINQITDKLVACKEQVPPDN
jgi:hypothetical protein